jgi:DNA-directed RNA polymerase subunit RPC12/RpoP
MIQTVSTLYNCKYCGTEYIADMTGFIPNCHNCGAKMERVDEYKI